MKPILFPKTATTFTSYGLGVLSDALSCVVTEERNGIFELEMTYPDMGIHFKDIEEGSIILAKPSQNQSNQAFRVYRISEPMDGTVTINAEHISYALKYIPVMPFTAQNVSGALAGISEHSAVTNPFTFHTDKTTTGVFTLGYPKSARNILGGESGSILQHYKGEYKWDNFDVYLLNERGSDNDVQLRYGKNITDFDKTSDLSDTVTGILPYWKGETDLVVGDISRVQSDLPIEMIATVDVSSSFNLEAGEKPTKAQVTAAGLKVLNNRSYAGVPNINFKISFVDLSQTEEYKDIAPLERVNLCDTVTIIYDKFGIKTKSKVIKTVYDSLLERYNNIEIGDTSYSLAATVAEQGIAVNDAYSRIEVLDDQILLKVSKGDVSSEISVETGQITISGNRLVVDSTNFKLYANGNATFSGSVTGASITGGTISGTSISGSTISSTGTGGTTTIQNGFITSTSGGSEVRIGNGSILADRIYLGDTNAQIIPSTLTLYNGNGQLSVNPSIISSTTALTIVADELITPVIKLEGYALERRSTTIPIAGGTSITVKYVGW